MNAIILIIFTIFTVNLVAQVPNGSFEKWSQFDNLELPLEWSSNKKIGFNTVEKVEKISDGDFAMKVSSKGQSFEGYSSGWARTTFKTNQFANVLKFSYKIDSINKGGVEIIVSQRFNNIFKEIGFWKNNYATQGSMQNSITFTQFNTDSLKIEIRANNEMTSTGYDGYSEIIIDKMTIDATSSIENDIFNEINVITIPSQELLLLEGKIHANTVYSIYDIKGQVIKEGVILNGQIQFSETGFYILTLKLNNYSKSFKFKMYEK